MTQMPYMMPNYAQQKAFEYKEKVEEKETPTEYVTKGEFDELKALVDKLSTKRVEQPRKANNGGTKA